VSLIWKPKYFKKCKKVLKKCLKAGPNCPVVGFFHVSKPPSPSPLSISMYGYRPSNEIREF
jgi:hypothetical protein